MKKGLYDAASEHDACGIGMVVNIRGDKTHELVDNALTVLENMSHRGAEGADGKSGDGAGILVQIPHEFILLQGIPVPEKGRYGTGLMFLPKDEGKRKRILESVRAEVEHDGCVLSHIREVPVNSACLGKDAAKGEPYTVQIFVTSAEFIEDADFERKLYRIRKHIERLGEDGYICSLSNRNIVYKGMLTSRQLREYYTDLTSQWFTSAMAIVHSRFSTNTFPQWSLAQPFRMLCHNGEINTIRGNRSWMQARQSVLNSGRLGDIGDLTPIVQPEMSDSASLDNVLEFLTMSGLSLPQAVSVLMPESFDETNPISEDLRAFYEYHSILMEPWDGPATLLFSDGRYAGGIQDRNGLRPGRYTITKRGILVLASEVGVLDFDPTEIECKGRLEPGKMLLVDTKEGKIWYDGEIKEKLASEHPYRKWLSAGRIQLEDLHSGRKIEHNEADLLHKELLFGCTAEDVENTIRPMCEHGIEATSSMGNDTPLAVLTERPQPFFNYFRQQFAQVTNPPIDSIREQMVMSLFEYIGRVGTGILTPDEDNCKMVRLPHPILTNTQLDLLCNIRYKGFNTVKLPMLFECAANTAAAASNLRRALSDLCRKAEKCVDDGVNYIILSDRDVDKAHAPIPSLLAVSAVHHHLIATGKRVQTALIVESGEIRETMHAALLLGYGASAINPYLSFAIISSLTHGGKMQLNYATARANYIEAINIMTFHSQEPVYRPLKGRAAQYENEIMVASGLSRILNKKIGDSITIASATRTEEYVITGYFDAVSNFGKMAVVTEEGMMRLGHHEVDVAYISLGDIGNKDAVISHLNSTYGNSLRAKEYEENRTLAIVKNVIIVVMNAFSYAIYAILFIFSAVIVGMVCKRSFIKERKDIGVCKAMGFTAGDLRKQFALRFSMVALIGSAAGGVLALFLSEPLLKVIFSVVGITDFTKKYSVFNVALPVVAICVSFYVCAYFSSRKVKSVEVRELITE